MHFVFIRESIWMYEEALSDIVALGNGPVYVVL